VAPIIRTCNIFFLWLGAAAASAAVARPAEQSALSAYVEARVAEAEGDGRAAVAAYAAALKAEPGSDVIALAAFRQAIDAGDRALALRAIDALERIGQLPQDGALLLTGVHLQKGDTKAAARAAAQLQDTKELSLLLPVIQSWIGIAAGDATAPDLIGAAGIADLGAGIITEQRALTGLLADRKIEALSLIRSAPPSEVGIGTLRLTAAATLQKKGDKQAALSLVQGRGESYVLARDRLTSGKPLEGAIVTAAQGLAYFYARLSTDLVREKSPYFALTMGRYARFLDPQSPFVIMAEAQALAANQWEEAALATLGAIPAGTAYAPVALESKLALLQRLDRAEDALALAVAKATKSGRAEDLAHQGDILLRLNRPAEAAEAYARAMAAPDKTGAPDQWQLLMQRGTAFARGGDWPAAEAELRRALALAPKQPSLLNMLGYSLLERREKIDEASQLIARAHALRPNDAAIMDSLGWAYFLSGQVGLAMPMLEQAMRSEPSDPTINEHLGDAYWHAGRKIEARYAWRAALLTAEEDAIVRLSEKADFGLTAKNAAR
jgi:tetratricopeptide (TPR) repeat protein